MTKKTLSRLIIAEYEKFFFGADKNRWPIVLSVF